MTRAQRLIELKGLSAEEAAIVSKPSNIFYMSGYTGEGFALIAQKVRAIITDFRYIEQAAQEARGFQVLAVEGPATHLQIAFEACRREGVRTVYYEDDEFTVRAWRKATGIFMGMELKSLGNGMEQLRRIKDADELGRIERACKISCGTFDRILPLIKEGMTERELARLIEFDMRNHGADKISFDVIAAAGLSGSKPHAVPSGYRIRRGDMITMDFGAKVQGYCADMTRTVALGEPGAEMRKVYGVVLRAQEMSQAAVKAGAACAAVDAVARDYIYAQGYEGRFGHGLGHSLGIDIHEEPRLSMLSKDVLEENQLITVEPGVYLPGIGGVRIENTVIVTKDGCRSLITPTKELIIL
ncbi:MAG: aminopeptidase P family protein [Bacillota bacterium]